MWQGRFMTMRKERSVGAGRCPLNLCVALIVFTTKGRLFLRRQKAFHRLGIVYAVRFLLQRILAVFLCTECRSRRNIVCRDPDKPDIGFLGHNSVIAGIFP
jgi:hypothetical protein